MVNFGRSQEQFSSRAVQDPYYERDGRSSVPDDYRLDSRRPPLPIEEGLRVACQIPGNSYFVVATQDNGEMIYLFSPSGSTSINPRRFFNENGFRVEINRVQPGDSAHSSPVILPDTEMSGYDSASGQPSSNHEITHGTSIPSVTNPTRENSALPNAAVSVMTRRRQRAPPRRGDVSMEERSGRAQSTGFRRIEIGNGDAVWALYEHRFRDCQQNACKLIAKSWIRAVEPKKQTTHPYTRGEEGRPDWWPRPWGPQPDQKVIHKEPDHIPKAARVRLLVHILRMVVQPPEHQHPAILKVRLDVAKLKAITFDALTAWFADAEHPANEKKRRFITEIFKVAAKEEEYKHGESDALTEVYVMNENGVPPDMEADGSDNEEVVNTPTSSTSLPPPLRHNDPSLMSSVYDHGHTESGVSTPNSFASSMTMRNDDYDPPTFNPDFSSERTHYVQGTNLLGHASGYIQAHMDISDIHPVAAEEGRRPSLFNPASEYSASWAGYNPPNAPSLYPFPAQEPNVQTGFEIAHSSSYLGQPYDGLSRQANDSVPHDTIYASRTVSHDSLHTQPTYPNYTPDGGDS